MMPTFQDIVDSYINGQYKQCLEQFKNLGDWERSDFIAHLKESQVLKDREKLGMACFIINRLIIDKGYR